MVAGGATRVASSTRPCYAMYDMACRAMIRYAMLCYAMPSYSYRERLALTQQLRRAKHRHQLRQRHRLAELACGGGNVRSSGAQEDAPRGARLSQHGSRAHATHTALQRAAMYRPTRRSGDRAQPSCPHSECQHPKYGDVRRRTIVNFEDSLERVRVRCEHVLHALLRQHLHDIV